MNDEIVDRVLNDDSAPTSTDDSGDRSSVGRMRKASNSAILAVGLVWGVIPFAIGGPTGTGLGISASSIVIVAAGLMVVNTLVSVSSASDKTKHRVFSLTFAVGALLFLVISFFAVVPELIATVLSGGPR